MTEFELQWLLLGLSVAFGLGWLASRLDLRQVKRENRESPRAYFKGLNLLLNEQQDKAIDAFIEAVQHNPDTTDLHFALGSLFRRRGEFERAVRVHQHLLGRGDLNATDRDRAQHELAQDFMKAGLFDRAEQAYKTLEGTLFDTEARLALLNMFERSRDWRAAADTATALERSGIGSFAVRIAHHGCELALEAEARSDSAAADAALAQARQTAPHAPRPLLMQGQRHAREGRHDLAAAIWAELRMRDLGSFQLIATDYADSARACGQTHVARALLQSSYEQMPGTDLLRALARLDGLDLPQAPGLLAHLRAMPTLTAAQAVLARPTQAWSDEAAEAVAAAVNRAAQPRQRYACASCGFETQRYFWQCPGCLGWDSFPPRRMDEL